MTDTFQRLESARVHKTSAKSATWRDIQTRFTYTRGDFSGFVHVSGFINFRALGFVGVYTERIFEFLTVYTRQQLRKHSR